MYDPRPARFISEDPIGFEGGDTNLYRYVFNSPTNYTDPTGLLVEGVFDMATGVLTLTDRDTGKTVSVDGYFSGNNGYKNNSYAEDLENGGPLPRGRYEIFYHPKDGFYRLDLIDKSPRNDRVDEGAGKGRLQFRLHYPGSSLGCISSDFNNFPKSENNWQQIVDILENTNKKEVFDNLTRIRSYLRRQGLELPSILPTGSRPKIIKFGEIEVRDSSRS